MRTTIKIFLVCLLYLASANASLGRQESGSRQQDTNNANPSQDLKITGKKILTGPKAWAIGCGAMLAERNHERLDCLETRQITEVTIWSVKKLLDDWWDIKNRQDLVQTLFLLKHQGHRQEFNEMVLEFGDMDEMRYKRMEKMIADDPDMLSELRIARKYGKMLGSKSILGWDYVRYIALCRWGYTCGYISEQEAWKKIMPIAKELQKTFDSWEDLGCNYIIGRYFHSYNDMVINSYIYEDTIQRLIEMPSSPWNKFPWNMNLEDANDANN